MIGRTLALYLFGRFLAAIGLAFASVGALIALVDFVDTFRRVSSAPHGTATQAVALTLMRTPAIAEQVLPFTVLAGCMIVFVILSRRMELVVARASGVSAWQFIAPAVVAAALVGAVATVAYNPLAAYLNQRADSAEAELVGGSSSDSSESSLWIRQTTRDGSAIVRAERSSDEGALLANVSVFAFDANDVYSERIEADRARLMPGRWRLEKARVIAPGAAPRRENVVFLPTNLTPTEVTQSFVAPAAVSFWRLPDVIRRIQAAGLDAAPYRLQFQTLLARPLLLVSMVLIAACFSLRFFRFGGVARTAAGGVAAGFVLYVASKFVGDLGGAGLVSAPVAAWSPGIVAVMLGSLVLLHQEDG